MSDESKTTTDERDELIQAIAEKVRAMGGEFTAEDAQKLIDSKIEELTADKEFVRKMRFGAEDDMGGKFRGLEPADVEYLGTLVEHPSDELRRALPTAYSDVMDDIEDQQYRHALQETRAGRRVDQGDTFGRAMDTAESGYGSQLTGLQYVGSLWEAARREARIWPLISTFSMSAPTAYIPVEVDFPELLYVSESTASNASNFTTSKTGSQRISVSATKFVMHQMWSGEMEEDSIIPYLPFLRRQATKALAYYQDSLVLNGDTTNAGTGNINLDDADPADTKHYLAWDGLRHVGLSDNTNNGTDAAGAITYEDFGDNLRVKMWDSTRFHDWGNPNNPGDLVFITDRSTANKVTQLSEVQTVDKYGPQATVLTGEVAMIARNPMIVSSAMGLTEADGKISTTAGNNTLGQVCAFNRNGFTLGIRRALKVEVERIPATDQTRIVYSMRWGFGRFTPTGAASGIEAAAVLYNITV